MCFVFLQTERFILRQWSPNDAETLWKIMSDSRVHQFTGDIPWTKKRTDEYIQFMLAQDARTLEVFHAACHLRSNGALIGLVGLNPYLPKKPEIEWQIGVPFWGKGYATEVGRAVIINAFSRTDVEVIYGITNPLNLGSIRVMEKIGMIYQGLQEFHSEQNLFYKINRNIF